MSEQPAPTPNGNADIWLLTITDMHRRRVLGINRYGTPLQTENGRDALQDAYEEALDLCVYLRQAIEERDAAKEVVEECPGDPEHSLEYPH